MPRAEAIQRSPQPSSFFTQPATILPRHGRQRSGLEFPTAVQDTYRLWYHLYKVQELKDRLDSRHCRH